MIDVINKAINKKIKSISFTEVINGLVEEINPLSIKINDRISIGLDFIEPKSLGISDNSPNPTLPFVIGDKVNLIRYNNGQRFYVLGATSGGMVLNCDGGHPDSNYGGIDVLSGGEVDGS